MVLKTLGGSGERGRTSFLLKVEEKRIVLDYGVKRKLSGKKDEIYPLEVRGKIDIFYLSHAHQDHSGAAPLLKYERLMCSEPTFSLIKHYVSTWFKTAKKYGLFINEQKYRSFLERDLEFSDENEAFNDITFEMGKSGHLVGSTWIRISWKGLSVLYTGDITLDSPLNLVDDLKKADVLILDTAYGTRVLPPREELLNLLDSLKGNRVILPLPSVGRSQEILHLLLENETIPVFVDEKIAKAFDILKRYKSWLKVVPKVGRINTKFPEKFPNGVYLTTDSMITSGSSLKLYEHLRNDGNTYFVLTGYQEEGTPGRKMLEEKNDRVREFIWKVHPDFKDVLKIIEDVEPSYVILFHSDRNDSLRVIKELEREGIRSAILDVGSSLMLEGIT